MKVAQADEKNYEDFKKEILLIVNNMVTEHEKPI